MLKLAWIFAFCILIEPAFTQKIEVAGHYGARGLVPENTIPSFLRALHEGVTGLHIGVAISGDGKVIVSSEPWMSSRICTDSLGRNIPVSEDKKLNIFTMSLKEIQSYDCGNKYLPEFPNQEKISVPKPLLHEMIATTERLIKSDRLSLPVYNIEIISGLTGDYIYHPPPDEYLTLVIDLIDQYLPRERVKILSADFRVLLILNQDYPDIQGGLIFETPLSVQQIDDSLGFVPSTLHPDQVHVTERLINDAHSKKSRVVPFTVNRTMDMLDHINMGVDGIITDYPDSARVIRLTRNQ